MFSLVHFGKGFTFQDAYTMPVHLRKFYLNEIIRVAKEKEKQIKKSNVGRK